MSEITDILANATVIGPTILPAESSATSVVAFAGGSAEPEAAATDVPESGSETPEAEPAPAEGEDGAAETLTEAEAETPEPAEAPPAQPPTRERGPMALRLGDLTKQRDEARAKTEEAEQRARLAQQEVDFWKQRALTPPPPPTETPPAPVPELPRYPNGRPLPPQEVAYADPAQYQVARLQYEDALLQWGIAEGFAQQARQQRDSEAIQAIRTQYPDYDQVTQASRVRLNDDVSTAILHHPERFALVYHLAQHPELEADLAPRQGVDAGLAVALLAQGLRPAAAPPSHEPPAPDAEAAETEPNGAAAPPVVEEVTQTPTRTVTQAPPPIAPTRGVGARAPRGYDDLSFEEFVKRRNEEERARWR